MKVEIEKINNGFVVRDEKISLYFATMGEALRRIMKGLKYEGPKVEIKDHSTYPPMICV